MQPHLLQTKDLFITGSSHTRQTINVLFSSSVGTTSNPLNKSCSSMPCMNFSFEFSLILNLSMFDLSACNPHVYSMSAYCSLYLTYLASSSGFNRFSLLQKNSLFWECKHCRYRRDPSSILQFSDTEWSQFVSCLKSYW